MRPRNAGLAVLAATLLALSGAACFAYSRKLHGEARWLLARGNAAAQEYLASFEGARVDAQLAAFEQRRAVLERAWSLERAGLLFAIAAALSLVCAWALKTVARMEKEVLELDPDRR